MSAKAPETVVITAPGLAEPAMALLRARQVRIVTMPLSTPPDELRAILQRESPHGIISRTLRLGRIELDQARALRVIAKFGAGYDNIDIEAATTRGIPVLAARSANAQSVAELAIGLMIAIARNIPGRDADIRRGIWNRTTNLGIELQNLVLGIAGFGSIGGRVGRFAECLGMKVHVYDPYFDPSVLGAGMIRHHRLDALLGAADVLTLHCPLTAETRRMLDQDRLKLLKPGAILINTARGGLVDEDALARTLTDRHLAGAAIDTFEVEPPALDSPLLKAPNVILTTHCGSLTSAADERVSMGAVRNLLAGLDGQAHLSEDLVNPIAIASRNK